MPPGSGNSRPDTPPPPVRIQKLVSGGAGLGYLDNGAVFVPLAAPGDLLSLKEVRRRRGVYFAEPDAILEAGPHRREPPCPWFGRCGGCQWMHVDYDCQVHWKEDILRQALRTIARMEKPPEVTVHSSPTEFHYRYRARLQIEGSKTGFFRRASNSVVPWDRCLLLPPVLDAAVSDLRAWLGGRGAVPGLASCEAALSPVDRSLTLNWIFRAGKGSTGAAKNIMETLEKTMAGKHYDLAGQAAHEDGGRKLGSRGGTLPLRVEGADLAASPGTFFQVHPEVNSILVRRVLAHLHSAGSASLLDLYCGNGNFSLPAAAAGLATMGVESSPASVLDGTSRSGPGSRFIQGDVAGFLSRDKETREAVIVDPPRTGLPQKVTGILAAKRFPLLLYVSCEPSTLARDLARLIRAGYLVQDLELFDMFPQTCHSETLVVMKG